MTSSVTLRPELAAVGAVDMEDLDALDLLQRAHAFAHDPLDALQELLAQTAGTRRFAQHVLRLVELPGACRVDLVALGRGERADLLRFRRGFAPRSSALRQSFAPRFISASALAVMRSASRSASRCAAIMSVSLRRSAISRSRAVIACSSAWMTLSAHRFGGGERRGALGGLLGELDRLAHFRDLDELVALGRERAHVAILGDARLLDAALGGDAGALDLLGGGDLGLLERLPLGDLQRLRDAARARAAI